MPSTHVHPFAITSTACGQPQSLLATNLIHTKSPFSNASKLYCSIIKTQVWNDDILKLLAIPKATLPEVKTYSGSYGDIDPTCLDKNNPNLKSPITGVNGDQQGALFGQLCTNVGDLKNTLWNRLFYFSKHKDQNG